MSELVLTSVIDIESITVGMNVELITPISGTVLKAFGVNGIPLITSIIVPSIKTAIGLRNTSDQNITVVPIIFCSGSRKRLIPIPLKDLEIGSGQIVVVEREFNQPLRIERISILRLTE